jgi:hypothetical protein
VTGKPTKKQVQELVALWSSLEHAKDAVKREVAHREQCREALYRAQKGVIAAEDKVERLRYQVEALVAATGVVE